MVRPKCLILDYYNTNFLINTIPPAIVTKTAKLKVIYNCARPVDIDNNTLTLTLYYDNGSNDVYNSQQYTYCSFPFSSEFYGKFATDSLDLVVKAASDRGSNYTEKKIKMAVKDFIAPREY